MISYVMANRIRSCLPRYGVYATSWGTDVTFGRWIGPASGRLLCGVVVSQQHLVAVCSACCLPACLPHARTHIHMLMAVTLVPLRMMRMNEDEDDDEDEDEDEDDDEDDDEDERG